jgi:hypothetical protein
MIIRGDGYPKNDDLVKIPQTVIPAKAGIQNFLKTLDSGSSPE